jgi:RsbRD-like negative regulator of sigma factor
VSDVVMTIEKKLSRPAIRAGKVKQSVASILIRDTDALIENWLSQVEDNPELNAVTLSRGDRTGHLRLITLDLVQRLTGSSDVKARISRSAREHGQLRRKQGYTIAMIVEESRILQVCIFDTLRKSMGSVDFDSVLQDVMIIADEVDSQLKQAVLGFVGPPSAVAAGAPA